MTIATARRPISRTAAHILGRILCGFGLWLLVGVAHAADFDRRWFIDGQVGYVAGGSFDASSGQVARVGIGRALYPRLRVVLEGQTLDMDLGDGGGTYTRDGALLRLEADLVRASRWSAGLVGATAYRDRGDSDTRGSGWIGQLGPTLTVVLGNNLHWVTDLRYEADIVGGNDGPEDDDIFAYTINSGLRLLFGTWPPPPDDRDHDGVPTVDDRCPDSPRNIAVDVFGCGLDSDADGIPDHLDQCPASPVSALVDERGCVLDSDSDGIPDIEDLCPDTPVNRVVDERGCGPDHDHDGVEDVLDACPGTAPMAPVDASGCPLAN